MTARTVKEWIGAPPDSRPPPRVRDRILQHYGNRCYLSGVEIRPGTPWEVEHIVALINGGENRESNLAPALKDKHREKTARDIAEKSRVYRKRAKHTGIRTAKHRPLPGTKRSGWRHRMDGTWERRT